jgi:basic amino acid/polyamine antiporter, APA family
MSATAGQQPVSGAQPRPTLTLFDAMSMVVGIVIGAGIFRAPSIVAGNVASEAAFLMLWLAGGLVSLVGALCYAELGSAFPSAGGEYYFLRRAFGGWLAFLFAWARMSVVQTGAIAAIAFAFGDYASQVWSLGAQSSAWYAAGAVILITAFNVSGTTQGKWLQNVLTVALAIGILAVVIAGIARPAPPAAVSAPSSAPWFSGLAIIFVMLTYGGWNEAAYLTAEIRDTRRNVVRALLGGLLVVTVLYLLMNFAYVRVLGLEGMRQSKAVAADLMKVAFSDTGAVVLSLIVIAATLSTLNATVFTGARTNYAVGRDYRLFRWLGHWAPGANAPVNALLWQGAIALSLVYFASSTKDGFETLVAYTAPAFWLFFLLTAVSLFVLRGQPPANPSPFRVPFYPVTPLVFCGMCGYMLWKSIEYAMSLDSGSAGARLGIAVLLAGVPLMLISVRREARV